MRPFVTVALAVCFAAVSLGSSNGAGFAPQPRPLSLPSQIVIGEIPAIRDGYLAVSAGAIDLYTGNLRTLQDRTDAMADPNVRAFSGHSFVEALLVNPVPHAGDVPGFNPFTIPEVRLALTWLADRDLIDRDFHGDLAVPAIVPFHPLQPEYARQLGFFRTIERQFDHDEARARETILNALGGVSGMSRAPDGRWFYEGLPLTVRFLIRVQDARLDMGNWFADQLESLGITVDRVLVTNAGIPYGGPPDQGNWHLYTEAWFYTSMIPWDDAILGFHTGSIGEPIWQYYEPPAELKAITDALAMETYGSLDERLELIRRGTELALRDAIRVWLVADTNVYVSAPDAAYVPDLMSGPTSFFGLRTARGSDPTSRLDVAQPSHLIFPYNPVALPPVVYDRLTIQTVSDPGLTIHPHTGRATPVRAFARVETAGPVGTLAVPADALVWDVTSRQFRAVGPDVRATSRVAFDFVLGPWQDGSLESMDDMWNQISHFYRRQAGDVIDPLTGTPYPPGDLSSDPSVLSDEARTFLASFKGARQVDPDTLELYLDTWHIDAMEIAARADVFPEAPWELQELMARTVLDGETTYSCCGPPVPLDLTTGGSLGFLSADLATMRAAGFVPAGFEGIISAAEASERWGALDAFVSNTGHFYVGNGPYRFDIVDVATRTVTLKRFDAYPFPADHWDHLLVPPIPEVVADIPDVLLAEENAQIRVETTLHDVPYDDVTVGFVFVNLDADTVVRTGTTTGVGSGVSKFELSGTDTAVPGAYELEVFAVGADAPTPVSLRHRVQVVAPGFLRVGTTPEVPSQILVDGVARDERALHDLRLLPGTYEIRFRDVAGYRTPSPISVVVQGRLTTEVVGEFEALGTLRVTTEPAVPSTIFLNGIPRNDWGLEASLPAGLYTVSFGAVAGYDPPHVQTVRLAPGETRTVVGSFAADPGAPGPDPSTYGLLRVTTNPPVRSTISLNGIPRNDWGLSWVKIPPGAYSVSFSDVYGRSTSPPILASVIAGQTTTVDAKFETLGNLRVITSPAVPATIYVDGIPRNRWGVWISLPTGAHTVSFGDVPGFGTPPAQTVDIVAEETTTVVGSYTDSVFRTSASEEPVRTYAAEPGHAPGPELSESARAAFARSRAVGPRADARTVTRDGW